VVWRAGCEILKFFLVRAGKVLLTCDYICAEMLAELAKREKQAGIFPEKDVDVYMKVGVSSLSYLCLFLFFIFL